MEGDREGGPGREGASQECILWEEERVPMWTCQSSLWSKPSSSRSQEVSGLGPGWGRLPPTCPPSPEQEQPFFTQAELRQRFPSSHSGVSSQMCLYPEHFWGQEVVPAENSWIDSENEPGLRRGGPFSFKQMLCVQVTSISSQAARW